MKKFLLLMLLALAPFAQGQIGYATAKRIIYGSVVPTSCNHLTGDIFHKTVLPNEGPYYCDSSNHYAYLVGASSGTVVSFTSNSTGISTLFTTSVATSTTTPALSYTLTQFAAHTFWGNGTGSLATPGAQAIGTADLPFTYTGNTTNLATVSGTIPNLHVAVGDGSGNLVDGGLAGAGGAGTVNPGTLNIIPAYTGTGTTVGPTTLSYDGTTLIVPATIQTTAGAGAAGTATLGTGSSTLGSLLDCGSGDGASNTEPCRVKLWASPRSSNLFTFLYSSTTAGRVCWSATDPVANCADPLARMSDILAGSAYQLNYNNNGVLAGTLGLNYDNRSTSKALVGEGQLWLGYTFNGTSYTPLTTSTVPPRITVQSVTNSKDDLIVALNDTGLSNSTVFLASPGGSASTGVPSGSTFHNAIQSYTADTKPGSLLTTGPFRLVQWGVKNAGVGVEDTYELIAKDTDEVVRFHKFLLEGRSASVTSLANSGYQDITEIASPGNPAAGKNRVYADSTAHALKCLTSSGGNCFPAATPTGTGFVHVTAGVQDGASKKVDLSLSADVTAILGHANGGNDVSTVTDDTILIADGANWVSKSIPNCVDSGGNHLNYTAATNALSCGTSGSGGASFPLTSPTANPATAGSLRLAVTDTIGYRNNANTGNLALGVDASDNLTWPGGIFSTSTNNPKVLAGGGSTSLTVAAYFACDSGDAASNGEPCFIQFKTSPGDTTSVYLAGTSEQRLARFTTVPSLDAVGNNRNIMMELADYQAQTGTAYTDTGSADLAAIAPQPLVSALADNMSFTFTAAAANLTATPSLAVNGISGKTIVTATGGALTPFDIQPTQKVRVVYDLASTKFRMAEHEYVRNWWQPFNASNTSATAATAIGVANQVRWFGVLVDHPVVASKIAFRVTTADAVNLYDLGLYNSAGTLVAHTGAASYAATGTQDVSLVGAPIFFPPGKYFFAYTGNATTALFMAGPANSGGFLLNAAAGTNSASGVLPSTQTPAAESWTGAMNTTGANTVYFELH